MEKLKKIIRTPVDRFSIAVQEEVMKYQAIGTVEEFAAFRTAEEQRNKGCEFCNRHGQHLKHIQDSVTLYKNSGNVKNAPYIIAELITGGDKAQGIRIESASADAVNRGFFEIHFCPMCGKRLGKRRESEVSE